LQKAVPETFQDRHAHDGANYKTYYLQNLILLSHNL